MAVGRAPGPLTVAFVRHDPTQWVPGVDGEPIERTAVRCARAGVYVLTFDRCVT
jgi:hypothetical protein